MSNSKGTGRGKVGVKRSQVPPDPFEILIEDLTGSLKDFHEDLSAVEHNFHLDVKDTK